MIDPSKFWRLKHWENDLYWLTGSSLPSLLHLYDLEAPSGKQITEIGIGVGSATAELARENKITAVDIVASALDRVAKIPNVATLHTGALITAVPADLAICHLVFQHCEDDEVLRILNDTPLKPDGVFAFQFAGCVRDSATYKPCDDEINRRLIWRTDEELDVLLNKTKLSPKRIKRAAFGTMYGPVKWTLITAKRS